MLKKKHFYFSGLNLQQDKIWGWSEEIWSGREETWSGHVEIWIGGVEIWNGRYEEIWSGDVEIWSGGGEKIWSGGPRHVLHCSIHQLTLLHGVMESWSRW